MKVFNQKGNQLLLEIACVDFYHSYFEDMFFSKLILPIGFIQILINKICHLLKEVSSPDIQNRLIRFTSEMLEKFSDEELYVVFPEIFPVIYTIWEGNSSVVFTSKEINYSNSFSINTIDLNFMNKNPINRRGSIESVDAEPDDVSIIKFMVENNCFEENMGNFEFIKEVKKQPIDLQRKRTEDFEREERRRMTICDDFNMMYQQYRNKIKNPPKKSVFDDREKNNNEEDGVMNFGIIIEGSSISLCLDKEISPYFWRILKKSRSASASMRTSPMASAIWRAARCR